MAAPRKSSKKAPAAAAPRVSTHPVRPLAAGDGRLAERLRKICLALPDASERLSHGEPTWFAGAGKGRSFAMLDNHHHGSPHLSVWLPQPPDVQQALIEAEPARFFRPPYVGPSGWVGVVLDTQPDWDMVESLVHEAHRHVTAPKPRRPAATTVVASRRRRSVAG